MSDDYLVRHCAPTLAGIKTGSLFTCPVRCPRELWDAVRRLNRRLLPKGLRILPLRLSDSKALIYVFRPQKLSSDIADTTAEGLLRSRGYDTSSCAKCIARLGQRIRAQEEFPHEIGLFLGYPPEDVQGFIDHGPDCCKCTGCWKVYGDPEAAQKKFSQYKKCTRVYCRQWEKNRDIQRLTVAG